MTGEAKHMELLDQPPTDEQAGRAELFLVRLLEYERNQNRSELREVAGHVREYLGDLDEHGSEAIQKLMENVERGVRSQWDTKKLGRPQRVTIDAITSTVVANVTNVAYELTQSETERDIDIGFLYEDSVEQRRN